jgi:hypothetical protein
MESQSSCSETNALVVPANTPTFSTATHSLIGRIGFDTSVRQCWVPAGMQAERTELQHQPDVKPSGSSN